MLKNYLKIALRTLIRHKGYTCLNLVGLATGIAASVLIVLFVHHETSFDKHHEHAANLYRVGIDSRASGQILKTTLTQAPLAQALATEFSEVVSTTRFYHVGRLLLRNEDHRYNEEQFFWADATVFDLFTIPLVVGDPVTALTQPHSVVLTEEMARKYFGEADPLGKTLEVNDGAEYKVTGVMRPSKANSHLEPDFLASLTTLPEADSDVWTDIRFRTYVLLREGTSPEDFAAQLPLIYTKYANTQLTQTLGKDHQDGLTTDFFVENVADIYLHSDADHQVGPTGDVQYVYIMSAIALFILLIAGINFTNLSTASSTQRAKEVGIRKVIGSERSQLILQFMGESVLMALSALILAYAMVSLSLPAFQHVAGVTLKLSAGIMLGMVGIALVIGLMAGIYPALVLSAFKPTTILKGTLKGGSTRSWLRSSLVVIQFAISITLLVGTAVVYKQLQFIQSKDLGFNKEHVVVLPIETKAGAEHFQDFRLRLLQHPDIIEVAASSVLPGQGRQGRRGFRKEGAPAEELFVADWGEVSPGYVETLGLEMVAGRSFSWEHLTDVEGFVLNEAAARMMGWSAQEAVGKRMLTVRDPDRAGPVLGVVKDAHFGSLHETVQPLIFSARYTSEVWYMPVRLKGGHVRETLAYLDEQWTAFEPAHMFDYFFLDEDYGRFYEQERRLGEIFGYFSLLAIFIACLGLFGLVAFVTHRRTKEIGIRKVMGASVMSIVVLLSKEFTYLVFIAALIAFPVAYYGMKQWLHNFAYAAPVSFDVYLLAGAATILIAWSTVSYHTIKAALADPVKSLRYE